MATGNLSQLESLPQDLLGEILSKVAHHSCSDIRVCMQVSPRLTEAVHDYRVYKSLNLRMLAMNPLDTIDNYQPLMEICLRNGNPEAHYIEGIKEYFYNHNTTNGLLHLQQSADGSYKEGIYLYGIVMLCRGNIEEGKSYIDKLGWKENKKTADRCWRKVQISLRDIFVVKKRRYRQSLRNNKPPRRCHRNDMDNRCKKCFYYKQMRKFMNLN